MNVATCSVCGRSFTKGGLKATRGAARSAKPLCPAHYFQQRRGTLGGPPRTWQGERQSIVAFLRYAAGMHPNRRIASALRHEAEAIERGEHRLGGH